MIKTIPIDIFLSFVVGQILALSAAPMLKKEDSMLNTYFLRAILFQLLVMIPIAYFLSWRWTAWSWMYFVDISRHSSLWTHAAIWTYLVAMIAGFHIAYLCIRAGKTAASYIYLAFGIVGACGFLFGLAGRVFLHIQNDFGNWTEAPSWFNAKGGPLIPWFWLWMFLVGIYFFVPLAYILLLNIRESSKLVNEGFEAPVTQEKSST